MMRGYMRLVLFWLVLIVVTSEEQTCPMKKTDCTCDFSSDAPEGGEEMASSAQSKSEMLAAAAGAMSPLLLGGAGLGIYKLLKKGGGDTTDTGMDRSVSDMSDTSSPRSLPPGYSSRNGTFHQESMPSFNNRSYQPTQPATGGDPNRWMGDF